MPVNLKVIQTKDFVKATAVGFLDFAESKQSLLDIASQINRPGEYQVLLDTRGAEEALSTTDIYALGVALADHPALRHSKIGLLAPMSHLENARFFETVAQNRGVVIRLFTELEQAITWLVTPEPPI